MSETPKLSVEAELMLLFGRSDAAEKARMYRDSVITAQGLSRNLEARRGLKVALHALKNVDGPFIEHDGEHGIFLAKEHDCTCWDAEQTISALLNGSTK